MKKKYVFASLIIMLALFVGGIYLLCNSTSIGQREGEKRIQANNGSMDSQQYYGVINSTTVNYRITGIIISIVGGLGILLSGYGIYKEV